MALGLPATFVRRGTDWLKLFGDCDFA
jgi:hypothetical protein